MNPKYTAIYNRPDVCRGDTIDGWSVLIKYKVNETPIIPDKATMQLQSPSGQIVHDFEVTVNPITGKIDIGHVSAEVTRAFRLGTYKYDLECKLPGGRVRTYLRGQIRILEDISYGSN